MHTEDEALFAVLVAILVFEIPAELLANLLANMHKQVLLLLVLVFILIDIEHVSNLLIGQLVAFSESYGEVKHFISTCLVSPAFNFYLRFCLGHSN